MAGLFAVVFEMTYSLFDGTNRAKVEAIEDEIHLHREKSKAEAAFYHKVSTALPVAFHSHNSI